MKPSFNLKNRFAEFILGVVVLFTLSQANATDLFWRTDGTAGTWTGANWGSSAPNTGGTTWTSGANANFTTAANNITFASATIGNVTVNADTTITAAGTLSTGGTVSTFIVADGVTLTWTSQNFSTTAGTGFIKNGNGTWNMGANGNAFPGGFTLNAGTIIVTGNNGVGGGALNINGGTFQSTGTRAFAATSLTVGGDFGLAGTGNATFGMPVGLGAATRNITNFTASGSRIFSGVISGSTGAGLNFWGNGVGQIYIGNSGNTFSGPVTINGSASLPEVGFASDGSFGAVPGSVVTNAIVIDGGRLDSSDTSGNAVTSTINSNRGIQLGATAGTSISVVKSTGLLIYAGVLADEPSVTGFLAKQGAGTLRLGGVSTYSGDTFVNNGTLQLTNGNNRLPTSTAINLGQSASSNLGILDLNTNSQQVAGLNSIPGNNATGSKNTVTSSTTAATLTLSGSGNYSYGDGSAANSGVIIGPIALVMNGSGTQTLGDVNTYTGSTTILQGTLAVGANGVITNSPVIEVAGGATLDVSAVTAGMALDSSETLKASGTGSAGTIATGSNPGLALGATSKLLFSAFNGTTAPLTISGSGAISLAGGNLVTVTNSSGSPFAAGDYKLVSKGASGSVAGAAPSSVTVAGSGIASGATASLQINSGELFLHVASGATSPATNSISFSGTTASIGVMGAPSSSYVLLTTTNLLGAWTPIKTNSTDVNGVLNFTDSNATNQQQFYRTAQQ